MLGKSTTLVGGIVVVVIGGALTLLNIFNDDVSAAILKCRCVVVLCVCVCCVKNE